MNNAAASRNIIQRGTPAGLRFFGYAALSLAIMWLDQRGGWLDAVRYGLQAVAYPLQMALGSPARAWEWTLTTFEQRASLQAENRELRQRIRELELLAMRRADLERENIALRGLRSGAADVAERWLVGRVIATENNRLRQRFTIDRGSINGVAKGQPVIAGGGLLGQVLRVGPWSSEIILLADPDHAVPVQIARTGQRTLALGTGREGELRLPLLPLQTDIRENDQLVSSGLGGVFPAGYPVATVTSVRRDGRSPLAQVTARMGAALDRERVVAFLWFRPQHPAAPARVATPTSVATAAPAAGTAAPDAATKAVRAP
ncbi:MAG: rod shape-determining protein MreC [Gammaproteobacteria bacterium]|nr:rod shape-determining protein MreC [Gammaproteobacteria bacterium]